MGLTFHRLDDAGAFLERAGDFLIAREAEHNLMLGVAIQVRDMPNPTADPPSFAVVTDRERVVAATMRTPPFNQVLSEVDTTDAIDLLAERLAAEPLPGVSGPKEAVARFADRWSALTGRRTRVEISERIFRLDRVVPPDRPAPGSWRLAEPRDRELIAAWLTAFSAEATPGQPTPGDSLEVADRWIARQYRTLYLWEDGEEVVCLVGAGGATPNGVRIGPVYTPPDLRGRGYATSLTAAATQDQLDQGRRFVTLFTDLANPTSNRIYQAIGYRPLRDVDVIGFEPDA
jgi:predicted GNAT family acetyltransferase